jgi:hypothetical protein
MPKHRPPQACRSRQQLHGRIADVLAERFPTMVEAEPEVMAHHYREAGTAYAASAYFELAVVDIRARSISFTTRPRRPYGADGFKGMVLAGIQSPCSARHG